MATFDTARVPDAARLDYWNQANTEAFSEISVDPRNDSLHGVLERRAHGALRIARVRSTAVTVHGGQASRSVTRAGGLLLHLQDQGISRNTQLRRSAVLRTGDITFCDASRPYTVECSHPVEMIVVSLPERLFSGRFPNIDELAALHVDGTRGGGAILGCCVRNLWRHCSEIAPTDPLSGESMVGALLELMQLISVGGHEPAPSRKLGSLHQEMSAFIEQRLADPELTVDALASAFGVSARHVHRVFAGSGTTPSSYIFDRRLSFAAGQLRNMGRYDSITDIALRSGFNDSTSFSRAFRRRYGVAPREYRGERRGN
jgi:AraC-like DNA-binding protein